MKMTNLLVNPFSLIDFSIQHFEYIIWPLRFLLKKSTDSFMGISWNMKIVFSLVALKILSLSLTLDNFTIMCLGDLWVESVWGFMSFM